ncbi:DNA-binding protein RFX5 isoform X1 [Lissotriton helveticus]
MADDDPYLSLSRMGPAEDAYESDILLQSLKPKIHSCVQSKVDSILQEVQKFSDNDKLYLYLQLPPGPSASEKSLDVNSLSTAEHKRACNWIRNHLEEHTDTCLPKQDVYESYKRYCDKLCCNPLSAANFGKIIREIFPNIKARRLGGRGQSKYCYSGIRRRTVVKMPSLPSLDLKTADTSELTDVVHSYSTDVVEASCALICNWAEKILQRSFDNVVEMAQYLIQQHIISPRCPSAKLVMSMVVSDGTENAQRSQKQPAPTSRNDKVEGSESVADSEKTEEKALKPLTNPQTADKKTTADGEKSASSPQVDALVARLPPLRPRMIPGEQTVGRCAQFQTPAPVFGQKITVPAISNSIQISPIPSSALPLTMSAGLNGAGLMSLQKAVPMINVILPRMPVGVSEIQIHPTVANNEKGMVGQSSEIRANDAPDIQKSTTAKRPLEQALVTDAAHEAASRKRRGRPCKVVGEPTLDAASSLSDSEKSSGVSPGALQGCSTVCGDDQLLDHSAEGVEHQEVRTVLQMGLRRVSTSCDISPSQPSMVEDSFGLKESDSIKNAAARNEAVKVDNRTSPNRDEFPEKLPYENVPSGTCPTIQHSLSTDEQTIRLTSNSRHNTESNVITTDIQQTRQIIMSSDGIGGGLASVASPLVSTKEDLVSTSQVSVIQDGRYSMHKYNLGLAQDQGRGKNQQAPEAIKHIPLPVDRVLAKGGAFQDSVKEPSQADPPAVDLGAAGSSTTGLSWSVISSRAHEDTNSGFLSKPRTGH